jgi:hypothetical protein
MLEREAEMAAEQAGEQVEPIVDEKPNIDASLVKISNQRLIRSGKNPLITKQRSCFRMIRP